MSIVDKPRVNLSGLWGDLEEVGGGVGLERKTKLFPSPKLNASSL